METNLPSKSDRTARAILDSAYALISSQGYAATSMRQIAEGAGLALGSIYNHFSSKEDIYKAIILDARANLRDDPGIQRYWKTARPDHSHNPGGMAHRLQGDHRRKASEEIAGKQRFDQKPRRAADELFLLDFRQKHVGVEVSDIGGSQILAVRLGLNRERIYNFPPPARCLIRSQFHRAVVVYRPSYSN